MLPSGVSLHITRSKLTGGDEAAVRAMTDAVEPDSQLLADAKPDLIYFHCTSATTFAPGVDDDIIRRIEGATGVPASTTSKALLAALNALGARTVSLITPYLHEINVREVAFLEHHGFEVLNEVGLGLEAPNDMLEVPPAQWLEMARTHTDPRADVCFLSCAATRAVECVEETEAAIGRPVLVSNQLAGWYAMRLVGVEDRIAGFGQLPARY